MRKARLALALSLACAFASRGFSQTSSGSISGTVLDPSGASVTNATVTLTNQQRGTSATTQTEASGAFAFPISDPGVYTLAVKAPGFKNFEKKDITLNANDRLALGRIGLEIGAASETVTVTGEAVLLKTESAERGDAILAKQVENIAVNGRGYLALTTLAPGVVNNNDYKTPGHGGLAGISANGARSNQNQLTVNGVSNVDTGNNGDQLATFSLDAVQEFKILTGVYQAEFGRSAGAQISVVTKSGTNDIHGSGYWYHRHESLNANNWRNNRDGLQRNKFRFNSPGYTVGGPVYIPKVFNKSKDKLFFFWSQEFQRQLRPQNERRITMPTALEREGDFSQTVDNNGNPFPYIKDPLSSSPCSASNTAGCFADGGVLGRIPKNRIDPNGQAILKIYPLPNVPAGVGAKGYNFTSQISDSYPRREDLVRIDYNATSKFRLFGHFINNADYYISNYGSFVLGANFPISPVKDARPGRSFGIGGVWTISPTTTNETMFGYGHNQINIDAQDDRMFKKTYGLSNLPILYPKAVQQDYIPQFSFNGSRLAAHPQTGSHNAPFFNYNTTLDWSDNFSKVMGSHVMKAGVFVQRSRKDQTSFANANGNFNFGDSSSNPLDTGYGYANAMVGVYNSFTQASVYATGMYRYTNAEWYLQDTWKATRRLTLDYGLRMSYYQPQFDAGLQTSTFSSVAFSQAKASRLYWPTFDANGVKIGVDRANGATTSAVNIGKIVPGTENLTNGVLQAGKDTSKYLMESRGIHWGPRFGLAFDVTGKQNIVIRTGAGVFYDRFQGNETFDMLTNPPTTVQPTLVNGFLKDINPASALLAPVGLNAFSPTGKLPTVYNYQFGVQWKTPGDFVVDTAYVGSVSRHLLQRINLNAIPYGATFAPENQDPTKVKASPTALLGSNAYDADFMRRYPGFGNITLHEMGGTSNYNSLQVGVNRRFSKGLLFQLAYTWSKALGVATNDGDFIRIDENTRKANYGPLGFDRRHNLVLNYVYEIPSLARHLGDRAIAKAIFGGWQISGLTQFQSGGPYGVGYSIGGVGNQNLTGSYTEGTRVVLLKNPNTGTSDPYRRLDATAFRPPYVGSRGLDAPTNYLIGPGINNFNISLQKEFVAKDRLRIQFRVDTFNAFNHTQFTGINSTINYRSLTDSTVTNLVYNADGSVNNKNGFGSVANARDPRYVQTMIRIQF